MSGSFDTRTGRRPWETFTINTLLPERSLFVSRCEWCRKLTRSGGSTVRCMFPVAIGGESLRVAVAIR